jgi:hypothetical protein
VAGHPQDISSIIPAVKECRAEFEKLFDWLEKVDYRAVMPDATSTMPRAQR